MRRENTKAVTRPLLSDTHRLHKLGMLSLIHLEGFKGMISFLMPGGCSKFHNKIYAVSVRMSVLHWYST